MATPPVYIVHPEPTLFSRLVTGAVPKGAKFYEFTEEDTPRLAPPTAAELRNYSERALKEALIHDLAALLNARRLEDVYEGWRRSQPRQNEIPAFAECWPLVARSVLNYGVTDLTAVPSARLRLTDREKRLKEALLTFEPRFDRESLKVSAEDPFEDEGRSVLRFSIRGDIVAALAVVPVRIQSVVDTGTSDVHLREARL